MVRETDQVVKSSDDRSRPLIGVLLSTPFQTVDENVHQALQGAGYTDIRPAHHIVFRLTGPGGARLVDLADRALMTKQSMGYLVNHLETCGYLERAPDPHDGRAKILQLTPLGRQVEHTARTAILTLQEHWAAQLGDEAFDELLSLLRRLNQCL